HLVLSAAVGAARVGDALEAAVPEGVPAGGVRAIVELAGKAEGAVHRRPHAPVATDAGCGLLHRLWPELPARVLDEGLHPPAGARGDPPLRVPHDELQPVGLLRLLTHLRLASEVEIAVGEPAGLAHVTQLLHAGGHPHAPALDVEVTHA